MKGQTEVDTKEAETIATLEFENGLLKVGLISVQLETLLINARLKHRFDDAEFQEWCAGDIADEELRADDLELYREIVAARSLIEDCKDIARETVQAARANLSSGDS